MKLYEYAILLKDQFSDKLQKLSAAAGVSESRVSTLQRKMDSTSASASSMGSAFSGLGRLLVGAFAVGSIMSFGNEIVQTTAKFQTYDAVLTNTLGSAEKARQSMDVIREFAAKTPFQVDELIGSYVKLANQGFTPTMEEMRKLGDLASSQGKSFGQLTEALLDATTFQFERLKEFGVKAEQNGNKVAFTFKGITTEVDKNADAVRNYLLSLGNMKGVAGGMEAISNTLGGQLSNLQDNFDSLKLKIGNLFSGNASNAISMLNKSLDSVNLFLDFINNNAESLSRVFAPLSNLVTPIADAFDYVTTSIKQSLGAGTSLNSIFNKIGSVIEYLSPLFKAIGETIGVIISKIFDIGKAIYDILSNSSLVTGFVNYFIKGLTQVAEAAKNILGGIGDLITGILTGNLDKIKTGFSSMLKGIGNTIDIPSKVMGGFKEGYGKGSLSNLVGNKNFFDTKNPERILNPESNFKDNITTVSNAANGGNDLRSIAGLKDEIKRLKEMFEKTPDEKVRKKLGLQIQDYEQRLKKMEGDRKDDTKQGADAISAGGQKTINIRLENVKFAETFTINVEKVDEAMDDVEDKFKEMFSRVLNGSLATANQ